MYCATVCFIVVSRRGMWALLCHWDMSGKCGLESANPRRYHEWQADGCRPRNHVAVVEFQPDVRHASAARTRHSDHITSWHFSSHNPFSDSVRGASLVRNVFGCWSRATWIAAASWQTTQVLRRRCADRRRPIRHRWRGLFSSCQNQL